MKRFFTMKTTAEISQEESALAQANIEDERRIDADFDKIVDRSIDDYQTRIERLRCCSAIMRNILGNLQVALEYPYINGSFTEEKVLENTVAAHWKTGNENDEITIISVTGTYKDLFRIVCITKSVTGTDAMHNAHFVSHDISFDDAYNYKLPIWFTAIIEMVIKAYSPKG